MPHTLGSQLPHGKVDAILMASGFSKRFGPENKLLHPFCGQPLALHTVALAAQAPGLSSVFLVYVEPEVGALAEGYPGVVPLHNQNPSRGACESIRLGVAASTADYYLFMTCDQPLLDGATLAALLAKRAPGRIVVPSYGGKQGSPTLFSATFREELLALADHENARILKQRHPQAVVPLELASPLPLADVDTPADLQRLSRYANG